MQSILPFLKIRLSLISKPDAINDSPLCALLKNNVKK
jgi:hypothetical protein